MTGRSPQMMTVIAVMMLWSTDALSFFWGMAIITAVWVMTGSLKLEVEPLKKGIL